MKKMEKRFIKFTILLAAISAFLYFVFTFYRYYNNAENIEKRCSLKFQKEFKKVMEKSDEQWGLNIDIANENYFKCMKIP